jgi:hypothetical protein
MTRGGHQMKKATQVGIVRTLNDARIPKAGYTSSRMVRGYGTVRYGYSVHAAGNDFIVRFDNPADRVPTIAKTEEQIATEKQAALVRFNTEINRIENALIAKGYQAAIEDGSVKVYNTTEEGK